VRRRKATATGGSYGGQSKAQGARSEVSGLDLQGFMKPGITEKSLSSPHFDPMKWDQFFFTAGHNPRMLNAGRRKVQKQSAGSLPSPNGGRARVGGER